MRNRETIDVNHNLYDQIIRLKEDKSIEQFLSELITRYSSDKHSHNKEINKINRSVEMLSIRDKFDFINNDENLSKFKLNKK